MNRERIETESRRLRALGREVTGAVLDVTDHAALDREIDSAAARYGRLDVVFANAGIDPGPGFIAPVPSVNARPTEPSRITRPSAGAGSSTSASLPCLRLQGPRPATCGRANQAGSSSRPPWPLSNVSR
jgi:NAD(P)-dependent dehydrogenase (short-subunit alcohol dehydrogenase family)